MAKSRKGKSRNRKKRLRAAKQDKLARTASNPPAPVGVSFKDDDAAAAAAPSDVATVSSIVTNVDHAASNPPEPVDVGVSAAKDAAAAAPSDVATVSSIVTNGDHAASNPPEPVGVNVSAAKDAAAAAALSDIATVSSVVTNGDMKEMGPGFTPETQVKSITPGHIVCIHQLFCQPKIDDPSGDCLIPANDYNLDRFITKELKPEMFEIYSPSAQSEGHPFIVEAAVSLGGEIAKQGFNIFCFVNGIRLRCEQGADFFTRTAINMIKWKHYRISKTKDKIGVFVNILTKIPFNGTEKEYFGDGTSKISSTAVEDSLRQCCRKLKVKIRAKLRAERAQETAQIMRYYAGPSAEVIYDFLQFEKRQESTRVTPQTLQLTKESLTQKFLLAADIVEKTGTLPEEPQEPL